MNVLTSTRGTMDSPARASWADWGGMAASIGCAIHCAAMPLVLAYLPSLGLGWLADEGFHRWMAVACLVLAAAAFMPGWRRHGSFAPAVWGAAGLVLVTSVAFGLEESCCTLCVPNESATSAEIDLDCALCQSDAGAESVSFISGAVPAAIVPFLTPLGGLLLVVGHILNHRKSCRCQGDSCCLSDEKESVVTLQ